MIAISLRQPDVDLILRYGRQRMFFRQSKAAVLGPLLIHASNQRPPRHAWTAAQIQGDLLSPFGALAGLVTCAAVADGYRRDDVLQERPDLRWLLYVVWRERYGYVVERPWRLASPPRYRGERDFFEVPADAYAGELAIDAEGQIHVAGDYAAAVTHVSG